MSKIKKPPVNIDNIPEVYEYYRDNPVNERVTRFGYGAFSAMFRSHEARHTQSRGQFHTTTRT